MNLSFFRDFHLLSGKSLKETLLKNFFVLSMGLILLTTIILGANEYHNQKKSLERDLKVWGGFLSSTMQVSLAYDDKEEAKRILSNLVGEERIKGVSLINLNMDIFYQHGPKRDLGFVKNIHEKVNIDQDYIKLKNQSYEYLLRPIKYQDDLYGWIILEVNMEYFWEKITFYLYLALTMLLLFMGVSFYLSDKAQRYVLKPVDDFIVEIERRHQALSNEQEIEKKSIFWNLREIDELYSKFESLFNSVEIQKKIIIEHNENLEKLVDKRTKELDVERQKSAHNAKLVAMGELASNISHEINNPLAIIKMGVRFVGKKLKKLKIEDEKITSNLNNATATIDRISGLISNLKLLAIDSSQAELEDVTFGEILSKTRDLIEMSPKRKAVEDIVFPEGQNEVQLNCKSAQIVQVLQALIINSLESVEKKYEDPSEAEVRIHAIDNGESLKIQVIDNGIGVKRETRADILKPFFTTKDEGQGTGLGLSMASTMLKGHDKSLEFSSDKKQTIFEFEINKTKLSNISKAA